MMKEQIIAKLKQHQARVLVHGSSIHATFPKKRSAELMASALKRQYGSKIAANHAYSDLIIYVY